MSLAKYEWAGGMHQLARFMFVNLAGQCIPTIPKGKPKIPTLFKLDFCFYKEFWQEMHTVTFIGLNEKFSNRGVVGKYWVQDT